MDDEVNVAYLEAPDLIARLQEVFVRLSRMAHTPMLEDFESLRACCDEVVGRWRKSSSVSFATMKSLEESDRRKGEDLKASARRLHEYSDTIASLRQENDSLRTLVDRLQSHIGRSLKAVAAESFEAEATAARTGEVMMKIAGKEKRGEGAPEDDATVPVAPLPPPLALPTSPTFHGFNDQLFRDMKRLQVENEELRSKISPSPTASFQLPSANPRSSLPPVPATLGMNVSALPYESSTLFSPLKEIQTSLLPHIVLPASLSLKTVRGGVLAPAAGGPVSTPASPFAPQVSQLSVEQQLLLSHSDNAVRRALSLVASTTPSTTPHTQGTLPTPPSVFPSAAATGDPIVQEMQPKPPAHNPSNVLLSREATPSIFLPQQAVASTNTSSSSAMTTSLSISLPLNVYTLATVSLLKEAVEKKIGRSCAGIGYMGKSLNSPSMLLSDAGVPAQSSVEIYYSHDHYSSDLSSRKEEGTATTKVTPDLPISKPPSRHQIIPPPVLPHTFQTPLSQNSHAVSNHTIALNSSAIPNYQQHTVSGLIPPISSTPQPQPSLPKPQHMPSRPGYALSGHGRNNYSSNNTYDNIINNNNNNSNNSNSNSDRNSNTNNGTTIPFTHTKEDEQLPSWAGSAMPGSGSSVVGAGTPGGGSSVARAGTPGGGSSVARAGTPGGGSSVAELELSGKSIAPSTVVTATKLPPIQEKEDDASSGTPQESGTPPPRPSP